MFKSTFLIDFLNISEKFDTIRSTFPTRSYIKIQYIPLNMYTAQINHSAQSKYHQKYAVSNIKDRALCSNVKTARYSLSQTHILHKIIALCTFVSYRKYSFESFKK